MTPHTAQRGKIAMENNFAIIVKSAEFIGIMSMHEYCAMRLDACSNIKKSKSCLLKRKCKVKASQLAQMIRRMIPQLDPCDSIFYC